MGKGNFNDEKIKRLPRDNNGSIQRFFVANGNNYKITEWEHGPPIDRWSAYEQWALMFTYNATPSQLVENNRKTTELLNRIMAGDKTISVLDVVAHQKSIIDGLITVSNQKYTRAMWLCSIFILKEKEDARIWDRTVAEQKIQDWIKEGYSVDDFFLLAQTISRQFSKDLQKHIMIGLSENAGVPKIKDDGTEIGSFKAIT